MDTHCMGCIENKNKSWTTKYFKLCYIYYYSFTIYYNPKNVLTAEIFMEVNFKHF